MYIDEYLPKKLKIKKYVKVYNTLNTNINTMNKHFKEESIETMNCLYSDHNELNYKNSIFQSLPENSKKYYVESSKKEIDDIVSKYSIGEDICRIVGF